MRKTHMLLCGFLLISVGRFDGATAQDSGSGDRIRLQGELLGAFEAAIAAADAISPYEIVSWDFPIGTTHRSSC